MKSINTREYVDPKPRKKHGASKDKTVDGGGILKKPSILDLNASINGSPDTKQNFSPLTGPRRMTLNANKTQT